jgi:fucose permease
MTERDGHFGLRFLMHVLFMVSGTATVLIGPMLPILADKFSLTDLQLSFLFPAQFSGSIIGTWLSGKFGARGRYVTASYIGAFLLAAGLLAFNTQQFVFTLGAFGCLGVGIGLTLASTNMTIIELSRDRTASALSVLNFCWGVGAIICKPFVDLTYNAGGIILSTAVLAAVMAVIGGLLLLQPGRSVHHATQSGTEASTGRAIWLTPLAWGIALFNFVHVGFESSMGGWLATYTERVETSSGIGLWLSPTLLYFLFFVTGRGVAPLLFRFFSENRMLLIGLFTVLAGIITCVAATSALVLSVGASIAGFGTSWIFPTNVSRFSNTFGPSATKHATPLFIFGTLGAAVSTWLVGFVSDRTGSLRGGMLVLVVSIAFLIGLQVVLSSKSKPPEIQR